MVPIHAEDFEGQEDHYIKLCSSTSLSSKQQKTCQEFNTYLQEKNKKLNIEAKKAKENAQNTEASLEKLVEDIAQLDQKILAAENDLAYAQKSIQNLQNQITKNKSLLEERMYTMQVVANSRSFVSYLFGAESFSDFFMRVSHLQQITNYDQQLIKDIQNDLDEVKKQEETLKQVKDQLNDNLAAQKVLQKKYLAKLEQENKALASNNSQISANQESMDVIKANLAALKKASEESKVENVTHATPNKTPSKPKPDEVKPKPDDEKPKPDDEKPTPDDNQKPDDDTTKPDENNQPDNDDTSSSEELGLKIANKALTRQGYMYVWGGAHTMNEIRNPNQKAFDCSGLVCWAHYQAGVDIGVQYTGSLASLGKSISRSNLQAGDIILFSSNGYASGIHHVGIYIGNNQMVHAPTEGQPVQVAKLSSTYWQNEWYSSRRLY